jgi:signal transduction histidine kinase
LISIEDSGAGILPEHMDKIFDPFFTTKCDGTGLGLAVCHGIIQRHEGEIDLQSAPGKGTTASIRLPLL